MDIWLLIIVATIFIICIVVGYIRGFLKLGLSLLSTILTLVLVLFLSPYVADALEKYTPVDDYIESRIVEAFIPEITEEDLSKVDLSGTPFADLSSEQLEDLNNLDWSLLGYEVLTDKTTGEVLIGGGLGYFISYEVGSFLAQCINFPLQRNITFKSKGNPVYQAMWYFIAWVAISLICNGFNNLWMPIAQQYVAPAIYNLLVTFITGGVSMIIFFFVFKIIFPEGEPDKK